MKMKTWSVVTLSLLAGAIGGQLAGGLIRPAYAAPTVISAKDAQEAIAQCDFTSLWSSLAGGCSACRSSGSTTASAPAR